MTTVSIVTHTLAAVCHWYIHLDNDTVWTPLTHL